MDQDLSFNCASCKFRYDSMTKKPVCLPCGDSICLVCSKKLKKCCVCFVVIDPNIGYPINKQLMNGADRKKDNIDMIVKIVFIGSQNVGKSSLLRALIEQPFQEKYDCTIGIDFKYCYRNFKGFNLKYQLWDTAGQQRFKSITRKYYKNANFIVITYDLFRTSQQNDVITWIREANQYESDDCKLIIVGNKKDLTHQNTINRPIEKFDLQFIQQRYPHIEVSCKTDFGIQNLWNVIDQNAIKNIKKPIQNKTKNIQDRKNIQPIKILNLRNQNWTFGDLLRSCC